jgi:hypothetical protein
MNLRHELAHYQRGDLWTTLMARCLALAQWFNPLAWWAASRFEAQCEFICDQASTSEDPAAFAEILIRLGRPPTPCRRTSHAKRQPVRAGPPAPDQLGPAGSLEVRASSRRGNRGPRCVRGASQGGRGV